MGINQMNSEDVFPFNLLPAEVKVLSYLDLDMKRCARLVCKGNREVIDSFLIKYNYNWKKELETRPDMQGANPSNFLHVLTPLYKLWLSDLTNVLIDVEYIHPETKASVYWIAKILKVQGYFVKLRYLSPSEETDNDSSGDFFMHLFDTCIPWDSNPWHCIGSYAKRFQRTLQSVPPPEILERFSMFRFSDNKHHWSDQFLKRRITEAGNLHIPLHRGVQKFLNRDSEHRVKIGDFCEVFGKNDASQVHIGIVRKIVGDRLMIQYRGAVEVEEVWCHRFSRKFFPLGWGKTVGYEIWLPANCTYDPPSIPSSEINAEISLFHNVYEEYKNLKVGMHLEIVDPAKPSQICSATITKVLKWGYFILKINYSGTKLHGPLLCRHITSQDIFQCGFAQKNAISFVPPSTNHCDHFNWESYFEKTATLPVPASLLLKDPCSKGDSDNQLSVNDKLEAIDWRDGCSLRPATITEVKEKLVKIHYDGFPCDQDQWVHSSSLDIYPLGWAQVSKYPLEFPANFEF